MRFFAREVVRRLVPGIVLTAWERPRALRPVRMTAGSDARAYCASQDLASSMQQVHAIAQGALTYDAWIADRRPAGMIEKPETRWLTPAPPSGGSDLASSCATYVSRRISPARRLASGWNAQAPASAAWRPARSASSLATCAS